MKHIGHMIEAVIFDFNGTLYFDSDIHIGAWKEIYKEISNGKDDFDEVFSSTFGSTNKDIIKNFYNHIGVEISDEEVDKISKHKETIYRNYSLEHNRCKLVDGASELMDYLQEKGYKINLSSASIYENIKFFFENFGIGKWIDIDKVTYDNGEYINKKQMYIDAAHNIGTTIDKCLIFEDSLYGASCAYEAGCQRIVLIDPSGEKAMIPGVIAKIKDFRDFNLELLND